MVRAADLITLPGIKKAPKKRIAAILEPVDEGVEQGDDNNALDESEEENNSDADESGKLCFFRLHIYNNRSTIIGLHNNFILLFSLIDCLYIIL